MKKLIGTVALSIISPNLFGQAVWPVASGSDVILHGYHEPITGVVGLLTPYFHNGVDVLGTGHAVVAMRAGVVAYSNQGDSGGTLSVLVTTPQGTEMDEYLHLDIHPWLIENTAVAAGESLGTVNTYFSQNGNLDHLHFARSAGGAIGSRCYDTCVGLSPWALFAPADQDPAQLVPSLFDSDGDGNTLVLTDATRVSTQRPFAWGGVDLILDVGDDMSRGSLDFQQVPRSVGYWIEAKAPGGSDVRSAMAPYMLFDHTASWTCVGNCYGVGMVYDLNRVVQSNINNWFTFANAILTNSEGTTGDPADFDPSQFWRTDASALASEPNGSDAAEALEIQEASFPDGPYDVHCLVRDQVNDTEFVIPLVVDNFQPYLRAVGIRPTGGSQAYLGNWTWNPGAGQLEFAATPALPSYHRSEDLKLTIIFSEPVASAEVSAISPSIGFLPSLTPNASGDTWFGLIPSSAFDPGGADDGVHGFEIRCEDLNGNTIVPTTSTAPRPGGFSKRTDDTITVEPGAVDTIHAFKIVP